MKPRCPDIQASHLGDTWVEPEELAYSRESQRRGLVRFPDGKLRIVRLKVADTYFSIPAKPSHGPSGFVCVGSEKQEFEFVPVHRA